MPCSCDTPSPVPQRLAALPEGVDGIRVTLRYMVKYAREYKKDVGIGTLARQLLEKIPGSANSKNYREFARALQHFVRDQIRYVPDIHETETLQTPARTLQIRTGDCDDKATLLAALLGSIGFATRFVAIGLKGGPYTHVLCEVKLGKDWIPCETIVDGKEIGWFPEGVTRWMPAHI